MILNCFLVGCGGFLGSIARYLCSFIRVDTGSFPAITLGINVLGSFAIMFLTGIFAKDAPVDSSLMLFLRVGLCGGFTTFSTFSAETLGLFESGNVAQAVIYAVFSVVLCIVGAWAGQASATAIAS